MYTWLGISTYKIYIAMIYILNNIQNRNDALCLIIFARIGYFMCLFTIKQYRTIKKTIKKHQL